MGERIGWMCDKRDAKPPKTGPLLPCPFCGETPHATWWHNAKLGTSIACYSDDCEVSPGMVAGTPSLAARRWNRRAHA